jgi:glutaredoxin 3
VRLLRAREDAPRLSQLPYEEISLDDDPAFRQTVLDATGGWTVPQILVDGQPIGGYTELWRFDREGRLDELLAA